MNKCAVDQRDLVAAEKARYLETTLGLPFRGGNRVTLLSNGDEIFPAMLEAIENADREINLVTYVYWTGDIAERFAKALAKRARHGLHVRTLLDAYGAARINDELVNEMKEAGVEVEWFRPLARWRIWNSDNRTHRKVLICDHDVAFTGGVGIAEEWEGNARNPSEWREIHVRIEGPAIDGLSAAFWNDWLEAKAYAQPAAFPERPSITSPGSERLLVVRSTATPNGSENCTLMSSLIAMARQRLFIATAYFVPDDCFVRLLCEASKRGVDVRVMMPGPHTDTRFDLLASESMYETLLAHGVRIFRFQTTMLHAKYIVLDEQYAFLGSTNFNQRSFKKDNEVSVVFDSADITGQLHEFWKRDQDDSVEVTGAEWAHRSWWQRIKEKATIPFQSQL